MNEAQINNKINGLALTAWYRNLGVRCTLLDRCEEHLGQRRWNGGSGLSPFSMATPDPRETSEITDGGSCRALAHRQEP
jgi:hypothetical protein